MISEKYQVKGMTCEHCVQAVSAEVGALPGVSAVAVDLAAGEVTLTSAEPLDLQQVRAAVDEAGYELVTA
jgi:copper ion binding protein